MSPCSQTIHHPEPKPLACSFQHSNAQSTQQSRGKPVCYLGALKKTQKRSPNTYTCSTRAYGKPIFSTRFFPAFHAATVLPPIPVSRDPLVHADCRNAHVYPSQTCIFCLGLAQFPRWRHDPLRHLAVRHGLLPHLAQNNGRIGGRYVGQFLLEALDVESIHSSSRQESHT
jgi:hypothetical protein